MKYSVHPAISYSQAIVRNLKSKTGRDLEEWRALLEKEAPAGEAERRDWLKQHHGLGGTTAALIALRAEGKGIAHTDEDAYLAAAPGYVEDMFQGKEPFFDTYRSILELAFRHFPELKVCPCETIVPLYRHHVFAQIKPATKTRLELGFCLRGYSGPLPESLIDTGGLKKGDRITHRLHFAAGQPVGDEVLHWLKIAYELDDKA